MKTHALYLRTIIFGVNDSLVSTVGFLAGISVAGVPRATIALTGIIYALVEAFSMAMGDFVSEESAEEYVSKSSVNNHSSVVAALFMFLASALAALIPLIPYLIFAGGTALLVSASASIIGLFVVGVLSARLSRLPVVWRGARMALLGGAAIVMGVAVGTFMPAL
ncbi:MAG: VIT1/CCC1 transporter family protein [Candidatus Paceibacterota bacterium]